MPGMYDKNGSIDHVIGDHQRDFEILAGVPGWEVKFFSQTGADDLHR